MILNRLEEGTRVSVASGEVTFRALADTLSGPKGQRCCLRYSPDADPTGMYVFALLFASCEPTPFAQMLEGLCRLNHSDCPEV